MNNPLRRFRERGNEKVSSPPAVARGGRPAPAPPARLSVVTSISFVRFSTKEQTLFAKRLAFLVKAGVPLIEGLHLIRTQTKSRSKRRVFDSVITDVTNGQRLSTGLKKFNRLFGDFAVNLIRIGEDSGVLSQNLAYLADELQKKQILQRKVIGALVYPIFITVATLGLTGLLTVYIFPKLMPIFTGLHAELPLTTRALIATSAFLRVWGIWLILGIIAVGVVYVLIRSRFERVRYMSDRILLSLPLAGNISRSYNLANFCRTLGLLLQSGIRLTQALEITSDTTTNRVYRAACAEIGARIIRGEPISRCLSDRSDLYPDILSNLVTIGERTGGLSGTFVYLGEMYEGEVDDLTKALSSSIEPVLMIIMGLLVGLIAVSVITPIYEITQHLQPR